MPLGAASFSEALRWGVETYHALKGILHDRGLSTAVGDEGGFAPDLGSNEEAVQLLVRGHREGRPHPGPGHRHRPRPGQLRDLPRRRVPPRGRGPDPQPARAWPSTCRAGSTSTRSCPSRTASTRRTGRAGPRSPPRSATACQLVGDDLFVTNSTRLARGIEAGVANSILIKVNQIGSLTETLDTVGLANRSGYTAVMSHRSGETEDTTIADLAVATNCGQIKTGAPARSDRVAKYNQLLRIESLLGEAARYRGWDALAAGRAAPVTASRPSPRRRASGARTSRPASAGGSARCCSPPRPCSPSPCWRSTCSRPARGSTSGPPLAETEPRAARARGRAQPPSSSGSPSSTPTSRSRRSPARSTASCSPGEEAYAVLPAPEKPVELPGAVALRRAARARPPGGAPTRPPPGSGARLGSRSRRTGPDGAGEGVPMSILGNRVLRSEDPKFLTVGGSYVADLRDPLLDGRAARRLRPLDGGPRHHHARSTSRRPATPPASSPSSPARTSPTCPTLPLAVPLLNPQHAQPVLARGKVRFVGEAIAAIVAETPAAAADAAELVWADIDFLPAVLTPEDAARRRHAAASRSPAPTPPSSCSSARTTPPSRAARSSSSTTPQPARRRLPPRGPLRRRHLGRRRLVHFGSTQAPHGVMAVLQGWYGLRGRTGPGRRARRRRRLRPQDRRVPRGGPARLAGQAGRPARALDRDPLREHGRHGPRPGPVAVRQDRRHPGRHGHRLPARTSPRTPAPTPRSARSSRS